jgi:hypothetical protein
LFIFRRGTDTVYLLLYIEDVILTASSTTLLRRTISALQWEFTMKDLTPLHHFVDNTVERRPGRMFLHQRTYTLDIIKRAAMADCKPCTTLVALQAKLTSLWASCSRRFPVSEHCRGFPVPDLHTPRHHLCCAADLSAYARPSRAPFDGHEAHPALSLGDARLQSSSTSFVQLRPHRLHGR